MLKQYKFLFSLQKISSFAFKTCQVQSKCFFSNSAEKHDQESEKPPEFFDPKKKISNNEFLKMELSQNEYEMIFRKNALKVLNIEEESK